MKGAGSSAGPLAMAYKLLDGATFKGGIKVAEDDTMRTDEGVAAERCSASHPPTLDNCYLDIANCPHGRGTVAEC